MERPTLRIPQATSKGFIEVPLGGCFDYSYPSSKTRRGRVQGGGLISPTVCAEVTAIAIFSDMKPTVERPEGPGWVYDEENQYWFRVRKLTPNEALKLMGVNGEDRAKLMSRDENGKQIISDTQLYKQAGNSIVVPVLTNTFRQLIDPVEVTEVEKDGQLCLL